MKISRFIPAAGICWLLVSAVQASLPAPADLREAGVRYERGEGVDMDYMRAYTLYCVAALQGDGQAASSLGRMNLAGHGVVANGAVAAYWFGLAERSGNKDAGGIPAQLGEVVPEMDAACPLSQSQVAPDRELVEKWVYLIAPEYGVQPRLVLAVISVESDFNARALSHKNARGLMQLLPATARRFGIEDEWDPLQNIRGGVSYLRWLIERYDGRLTRVLAAYNAGEHAVDKYGGVPPYRETKSYVRNILIKYGRYMHPVEPLPISETGMMLLADPDSAVAMNSASADTAKR